MLFTKQHLGIPVTQLSHHVIILVTRTQANHSCRLVTFTLRVVKTHLHYYITYKEAYVCRKGFPSINVQVVCNHNLLLMDVLVKWPGSTHDTAIWNHMDGSSETLGTGYPQRSYIMVPLADPTVPSQSNGTQLNGLSEC